MNPTDDELTALMLDVGHIVSQRLDGAHPEAALCVAGFIATTALRCLPEPQRTAEAQRFTAAVLERTQQQANPQPVH